MRARGHSRLATTFADPPATGSSRKPKVNTGIVLLMAPSMDSEESSSTSTVASHASGICYMDYPDESIPRDELPNTDLSRDSEELVAIEGQRDSFRPAMVLLQGPFKQEKPG